MYANIADSVELSNICEHRINMFAIIHVDELDCDPELFHVLDKIHQYSHKSI